MRYRYRKGFSSIAIIMITTFFVTVLIAVNSFNSQINFSNQRDVVERQVYYNAYAGLQKAIFHIQHDFDYSVNNSFIIDSEHINNYYTELKVGNTELSEDLKKFRIESTGYSSFKQSRISQTLVAELTLDTSVDEGIIRFDTIKFN